MYYVKKVHASPRICIRAFTIGKFNKTSFKSKKIGFGPIFDEISVHTLYLKERTISFFFHIDQSDNGRGMLLYIN